MSRTLKNFLMIFILLIMVLINVFTIVKVNDDIYSRVYIQDIGVDENVGLVRPEINDKASINHYILFIGEGIIISSLTIYLIISKFNKKSLKETFDKIVKVLLFCLSVLVLTTIITAIDVKMAENYYLIR